MPPAKKKISIPVGTGKCDPDAFLKKELLDSAAKKLAVTPKSLLPLTKAQLCDIVDGKSPSKVSEKAVAAVARASSGPPVARGRPRSTSSPPTVGRKSPTPKPKKVPVTKKSPKPKASGKAASGSAKPKASGKAASGSVKPCPGGLKKSEVAKKVAKKFPDVDEEMAMRLTVSKMCEALDLGVAPPIPAAKKRRPVYSPDFISVGGRVADTPPKKGAKPKKAPKALPPLVGRGGTGTPSPLRFVNLPYAVPASPKPSVPLPRAVEKLECVRNSKLTLKDHQLRVVNHFQTNRGLIVAHPVGSGKTLEGVTVASCFLMKHPDGVVKVVTPVSLQHNFEKELLAAGVRSDRIELYTLAAFATQHGPGGAKEGTCSSRSGKGTTKKRRPVLLIIDEAHELRTNISKARNSGKTVRAEVAVRCAMEADEVLLLTATAVYNEPYDIASLVAMVKGTVPLSVKSFESLVYEDEKRGPTQDQKRRFAEYFGCMFSFHDMPRDSNYPTVIERYIEIEMSAQYFKEYKEVERRNSSLFSGANPFLFLSGVRRASNALSSCPKCDVVMDFVQKGLPVSVTAQGIPQFGTIAAMRGKKPIKVVVYSAFREFGVDQISERLRSAGIPYGEVNGSMPKDKRQKAVDGYNADKLQVLLITAAGGQGLDLKGTRVIILFEEQWNSSIEDQAKGRAVRYGSHSHLPESERSVQIYHLVMIKPRSSKDKRPSADTILKELVEEKRAKNVKFLKRLQEVSIEKLACGSFPITPAAKVFSPVAAPKEKKVTAKKGRTWAKLVDLAKKIFARGGDYQESNDDFDLVIGTNVITLQHRSRTGDVWLGTNKKGEIFATLSGESPFGYAKGDTIPSKIEKSATLLEDLLEDILFTTGKLEKEGKGSPTPSPRKKLSPPKPSILPAGLAKKSPPKSISQSKLEFTRLFMEARENTKDMSEEQVTAALEKTFPGTVFFKNTISFPGDRVKLFYNSSGQRWLAGLAIENSGLTDVSLSNSSRDFAFEAVPTGVLAAAIKRLEFLRDLKVESEEYFMDGFYRDMAKAYEKTLMVYGKKEVNWEVVRGLIEFSFVGKILGVRVRNVGMITYNSHTQKVIFYDAKGQMQNPYALGDSKTGGKWLKFSEHPQSVQEFFNQMDYALQIYMRYTDGKL